MVSKRKSLGVDEKVFVIRAIEKGEKQIDVGRRFGFSPSTVATIWKNKEKILQAERDGKSSKKLRKPKFEDVDQAVLTWLNRQRQNNVYISGPYIKAQAEKFASQLGTTDFKASEGWLGKFTQRHKINRGKTNGELQNVEMVLINDEETGEQMIESVIKEENLKEDEQDQMDDPKPPPNIQQALDAAKLLGEFLLFYEDDPTASEYMDTIYKKIKTKYWLSKKCKTKRNL
ncbi:unnamed protein product [Parnassius mnemosyne]|uniref:HTH CENPB-type domain-containing protein n=1 Tax=Parnassius mnemosyne TaxID=213953 RepID=A0AAV1LD78_9NEOP